LEDLGFERVFPALRTAKWVVGLDQDSVLGKMLKQGIRGAERHGKVSSQIGEFCHQRSGARDRVKHERSTSQPSIALQKIEQTAPSLNAVERDWNA